MKSAAHNENLRQTIRDYLTMVSDHSLQMKEGPEEIFCMWFDDLYFPAFDPGSYDAGVFEQGLRFFKSCFSEEELSALRNFHEYFRSIHEIDIERDFNELQKDPAWIELGAEAQRALAAFKK